MEWVILAVLLSACVPHITTGIVTNVALMKHAWMSSTYDPNNPASKAVDGDTNASSYSDVAHTGSRNHIAWWKVDLQTEIQSARVILYFRTDFILRRNGVQFYTSGTNSSDPKEGNLCHKVTGRADGTDIPDVLNVTCPGTWRYLTVYTETDNEGRGPILDFAEVQVWSCPVGMYGLNCDKACTSRHCVSSTESCDSFTGACSSGQCQTGWTGTDCSVCVDGKYGPNCVNDCSSRHCKTPSTTCDHISGACSASGCLDGWMGEDCTTVCSSGKYGANCAKDCRSRHCKISTPTCDRISGACPDDGCKDGWTGADCTTVCAYGEYGANCANDCSRHCKISSVTCDRMSGTCPSGGCEDGWTGLECSTKCPSGTYGTNCNNTCGHCANNDTCHHVTGICAGGCEAGLQDDLCQKVLTNCPDGRYGPKCTEFCDSRNCKTPSPVCDITGSCTDGCREGWQNGDCRISCPSGKYGSNCSKSCVSRHCNTARTACDHVSGACITGCREGWIGADCTQRCKPGTYGPGCSRCGYCDVTCNVGDGLCPGECLDGFTGDRCDVDVRASAVKIGVIEGAVGVAIGIAVTLLLVGGLFLCLLRRGRLKWYPSNAAEPTEGRQAGAGSTDGSSTRTPAPAVKDTDYTELNEVTREREEKAPYDVIQNHVYENDQI